MNLNSSKDWIKIIILLSAIILLLIGFIIGYFYGDKSCIENPFTYGIKEINELNDDKFICSCFSTSSEKKSFSFDEYGINNFP